MAEVKDVGEPTFPMKRNPDPSCPESKKQKLENPDQNLTLTEDHMKENGTKDLGASESRDEVVQKEKEAEPEVESREGAEEEEAEQSKGKAVIDRKGKGIMIEEEEDIDSDDEEDDDSDDDDSSDEDGGENLSGCESDLSDNPLAEVDLDNILPSRTRRRVVQPGAYIANDMGNDDDDSDDSDA